MEPAGRIAYEAWRQSIAKAEVNQGHDVAGSAEWEDLSPEEREAWQSAADAVVEWLG